MCIDIQLCQCTDVDLVLIDPWNILGHIFVQSMDPLNDNRLITIYGKKRILLPFPHPCDKVIAWDLNLLPREELNHIFVK